MTLAFPPVQRPLVEVEGLTVAFGRDAPAVVSNVSFKVMGGECVAIVGESGSGKSVTARSLIGLAGAGAVTSADRLSFAGRDLRSNGERDWRRLRGRQVGFILQDALGSLDPLRRIGEEIDEPLRLHGDLGRSGRGARVVDLLRRVGVPEPELRARQRPGQLSGGLRQRALIASAIACDPDLVIADEPTTALDAAVQAQILALFGELRSSGAALLLISHDLAVVASLADRIIVMHKGRIVEHGPAETILRAPRHSYTQSLVSAASAIHGGHRPRSVVTRLPDVHPLVEVESVSKTYPTPDGGGRTVVSDVSLAIHPGETLGLVGASGSGKTTAARLLLALERPDAGTVRINGQAWSRLTLREQRAERRRLQVVFQDPLASFDPRYTVFRVIDEAIGVHGAQPVQERRERAAELLRQVRLDGGLLDRRPIELSGGQRQRVAIARALAAEPEVIVCDEPVSALDVSVQAEVLALLDDLKARLGLACLFISHDLGVVRRVSDRVAVMHEGRVVEEGPTERVFAAPQHDYTRTLLAAIPSLEPQMVRHHA